MAGEGQPWAGLTQPWRPACPVNGGPGQEPCVRVCEVRVLPEDPPHPVPRTPASGGGLTLRASTGDKDRNQAEKALSPL